jgi:hypothetical protein
LSAVPIAQSEIILSVIPVCRPTGVFRDIFCHSCPVSRGRV